VLLEEENEFDDDADELDELDEVPGVLDEAEFTPPGLPNACCWNCPRLVGPSLVGVVATISCWVVCPSP
jgi:hypothetical protein